MEVKKSFQVLSKLSRMLLGAKLTYCLKYYHQRGHFPNLKNPKDLSEILLSKMFNPAICKEYAQYVDKLLVRDYVENKGLGNILLKHYGVWNSPQEIPFDSLPEKFVLKSNNGCGHHVICSNKSELKVEEAIQTLNLAIKSGRHNVEPHYHYITPKVFAEELIETSDGSLPIDYKFTCIGGEIMDVFVATERANGTKYITLDLNWQPLPYIKKEYVPKQVPPRPNNLDELVAIAQILSKDFDIVRVDLYEYRNKPYISELTFFPWGGLLYGYTDDAIQLYGKKWMSLKNVN